MTPRIRLSCGYALAAPPQPMRAVRLTPAELCLLARTLGREADAAAADGRHELADRLAARAADLREAGQ